MKKILVILTAIIIFIFSFSESIYASEVNFTDIEQKDWFYKNLQDLTQKDIVGGYPDGTFKPNDNLKFEEFIKMVVVAVVDEPVNVSEGLLWYQSYINIALENNYIDKLMLLNIGQNIDRATMAEVLYNVLSNTKDLEQFDTEKMDYLKKLFSDLSKDDTKTLTIAGMGLICGYPDGTYKPNDSLKRSETVAVISRLIDKEQRLPVDFDVVITPPSGTSGMTLDELPKIDLSHLYDYPTLLGSTVKAENKANNLWVNTDVIASEYTEYMRLTHNRDYTTINNKAAQYKKDLLYYLNGYKEYKGKKYDAGLKSYYTNFSKNDSQEYRDYILSLDNYIEDFLNKWVQDTIDNKVKVQAKFYTSDDLVIKADAVQAVRGTLRFKYDSHNNPSNIKEELDLVDRNIKVKGQGILNLDESKYNIYMEYNELPNFQVGKWYEIDMDIVVANTAFTKGLEEKATHSYRYIYPIEARELK